MNKKTNIILSSMIATVFIAGCGQNADISTEIKNDSETTKNQENSPVSDNVITWMSVDYPSIDEDVELKINQVLYKRGYDFAVHFTNPMADLEEEYELMDPAQYDLALSEFEKINGSPDIVLAGVNEYTLKQIEEGYLLCLDDYLSSDAGIDFYDYYPENFWNVTRYKGSIYSIPMERSCDRIGYTFLFNADYFTQQEIEQFDGNLASVEQLVAGKNVEFTPIVYSAGMKFVEPLGYEIFKGCLIDRANGKAQPFFQDERVADYIRQLCELKEKGLLKQDDYDIDPGEYLVYITNGVTDQDRAVIGDAIPKIITTQSLKSNFVNSIGIPVNSKHKDEAFTFLKLAHTDNEIANLMLYGIEGVDYEKKDGKVQLINQDNYGKVVLRSVFFGMLIAADENIYDGRMDKQATMREYLENDAIWEKYSGFNCTDEEFVSSEYEIQQIFHFFEEHLFSTDTYDEICEWLKGQLEKAGESSHIEDLNERLKEYEENSR